MRSVCSQIEIGVDREAFKACQLTRLAARPDIGVMLYGNVWKRPLRTYGMLRVSALATAGNQRSCSRGASAHLDAGEHDASGVYYCALIARDCVYRKGLVMSTVSNFWPWLISSLISTSQPLSIAAATIVAS